ncbi:unnamed protein product [Rotaria socialis]|uniref:Uncharacterized protein n=1 Tax=Rotaria socialis TaxID=392032 RepID=A0A820RD17_9BILA|nr:unnamed protein product [Rotaria socialis]CAF4643837.1 unnamed protein product [Rotaria socialis]
MFSFSSTRGACYFYGQISNSTSMWQPIDLTNKVNSVLIDNGTLRFNFSAWLGGTDNQDGCASVFLTFISQTSQMIGSYIRIGPALVTNRGNITSLIFEQANGFVSVGTRSMTLLVTMALLMTSPSFCISNQ